MPCTGDIFNHHNKELVGIKWSCKGTAKLSGQAGSEFVGSRVQGLTLRVCTGTHAFVHFSFLAITQTLTHILPVTPVYLSALTPPQKDNCRPANFITTALNCTVLEPSNYSSFRCGWVEKGRKSTEVEAPSLELWENWKQMICPFPYSSLLSPSLFPTPLSLCPPPLASKDNKGRHWRTKTGWMSGRCSMVGCHYSDPPPPNLLA